MKDFVIVATFTLPTQMVVAKSKLESLGIECITKDELTIQSYNFLSNAVGGVKLLVHKSNLDEARAALIEGGFILEDVRSPTKTEKFLSNPKNLKRIYSLAIVALVLALALGIFFVVYSTLNKPDKAQILIGTSWCLDFFVFNEAYYYPKQIETGATFQIVDSCPEKLDFNGDGTVIMPGINSRKIKLNWTIENDKLTLFNADTLGTIFNRSFDIRIRQGELTIRSPKISYYCFRN